MSRSLSVFFVAIAILAASVANAQTARERMEMQIDQYVLQSGIYVPRIARDAMTKKVDAEHSLKKWSQERAKKIYADPAKKLREAPTTTAGNLWTPQVSAETSLAAINAESAQAYFAVLAQKIGLWLEQYPIIRVVVQPSPPKDFLLTINEERCPSTEKATYRVPAGPIVVRVWRPGSAVCEKTYNAVSGQLYEVHCAL